MKWKDIRDNYPHQWILIEAINAYTESGKRVLDQVTVVNTFTDPLTAMEYYKQIHKKFPEREFYVLHTDQEAPDIYERKWMGIRGIK